ncbi:hypothetical protein D3C85_1551680 [compost metagenome]
MSIKPSESRWEMRTEMITANHLIEGYLAKQHQGCFVNIWNLLLDKYGKPNANLYLEDKLHLNAEGYEILTRELNKYVNNDAD